MMNVETWRSRLVIAGAAALLLGQGAARGQASAITLLPPPALLTILPPLPALSSTQADAVRLVVKLGQRRVYVYRGEQVLAKYRIAIGKRGWETPTGSFQVLSKEKNPVFKSFRTGKLIKPGPDNPLGVRWIGIWTDGKTQLGFHGTNQEELLGQAVSHGCIRMRNRDVTAMFDLVSLGTEVIVER